MTHDAYPGSSVSKLIAERDELAAEVKRLRAEGEKLLNQTTASARELIVERDAWRAIIDKARPDSVTMTETEFKRFWKGLGHRETPQQGATLYGIPITVVPDVDE